MTPKGVIVNVSFHDEYTRKTNSPIKIMNINLTKDKRSTFLRKFLSMSNTQYTKEEKRVPQSFIKTSL